MKSVVLCVLLAVFVAADIAPFDDNLFVDFLVKYRKEYTQEEALRRHDVRSGGAQAIELKRSNCTNARNRYSNKTSSLLRNITATRTPHSSVCATTSCCKRFNLTVVGITEFADMTNEEFIAAKVSTSNKRTASILK